MINFLKNIPKISFYCNTIHLIYYFYFTFNSTEKLLICIEIFINYIIKKLLIYTFIRKINRLNNIN